ncbi:hypothetical protein BDD12DRAFT_268651 [Trichophaea hybrida]|nr:hypothetical protein BDD12DRAFT_268651 [Trichophaea hybrida]
MSSSYISLGLNPTNDIFIVNFLQRVDFNLQSQHGLTLLQVFPNIFVSHPPGFLLLLFVASASTFSGTMVWLHWSGFLTPTTILVSTIIGICASPWFTNDMSEFLLVFYPLSLNIGVFVSYIIVLGRYFHQCGIRRNGVHACVSVQAKGYVGGH